MKIINKICIAAVAIFTMQSCSDDFYDVNDSQDNPTGSSPELTLPVAQKMTADYISGGYNSPNTLGNLWTHAWTAAGDYIYFTDEMQYNITAGFRAATFESAYLALANYDYVEDFGTTTDPETGETTGGEEYSYYQAIAKIMKAYHFQYLVDVYGDVPYTEAFGAGANPTPAYDEGQFIYNEIFEDLNEAIALIDGADENVLTVGSEDIMLGGDMDTWAAFANTLKLRILLRQTEIATSFGEEYAEIAASPYGFITESVYVNPGYVQEAGKQNPLWNAFGETPAGDPAANNQATRATIYILDKLEELNDPRLDELYAPAPNTGTFIGIEQNDNSADAPVSGDLSPVGPGVLEGPEQDAIVMQAAESFFLQAEAAQRGFIPGDAQNLYEQGIEASFEELGEDDLAPETYYNLNIENVGWNASDNKIEAIITQKYVALIGTHGLENWIEYRRTGYPADIPVAPRATSTTIPVRLLYPTSELGTNAENVPAQSNSDAFNTPVFWDE